MYLQPCHMSVSGIWSSQVPWNWVWILWKEGNWIWWPWASWPDYHHHFHLQQWNLFWGLSCCSEDIRDRHCLLFSTTATAVCQPEYHLRPSYQRVWNKELKVRSEAVYSFTERFLWLPFFLSWPLNTRTHTHVHWHRPTPPLLIPHRVVCLSSPLFLLLDLPCSSSSMFVCFFSVSPSLVGLCTNNKGLLSVKHPFFLLLFLRLSPLLSSPHGLPAHTVTVWTNHTMDPPAIELYKRRQAVFSQLEDELRWKPWLTPNYEHIFRGTHLALGVPWRCRKAPPASLPANLLPKLQVWYLHFSMDTQSLASVLLSRAEAQLLLPGESSTPAAVTLRSLSNSQWCVKMTFFSFFPWDYKS